MADHLALVGCAPDVRLAGLPNEPKAQANDRRCSPAFSSPSRLSRSYHETVEEYDIDYLVS